MPSAMSWATRSASMRRATSTGAIKVFGLPTQFFIRPDGVIDAVGKTVDEATAVARIEAILP